MSDEERQRMIQAFTAIYGPCDKHVTEETWLNWLGIWSLAWQCCLGNIDFSPRKQEALP